MLRAVEQEASSGVVAIATTMTDAASHITLCSGALVAPNLVLTARHCVSRAVTATPSCDARGRSHNGDHLAEDVDPAAIAIYTGTHVRPDVDAPVARAVRTLHPTGQILCDADVAFLVLDRPVLNSTILSMRLHAPVETGDIVVPVGFGVDRATCRGDSGGPAIDVSSGEIVGVVSRGGSCSAHGNHVYTRVDAYNRLATAAFAAADREAKFAAREVPAVPDRERERTER